MAKRREKGLFKNKLAVSILLILDDKSDHVAHVLKAFFQGKNQICDCSQFIQMQKNRSDNQENSACANLFLMLPSHISIMDFLRN